MRLLGKRVGFRQLDSSAQSPGGIWYPVEKEASQEGIVELVGDEVVGVKVGDRVLVDKYAGVRLERVGKRSLVVVLEEDVLARVEV